MFTSMFSSCMNPYHTIYLHSVSISASARTKQTHPCASTQRSVHGFLVDHLKITTCHVQLIVAPSKSIPAIY